MRFTVRVLRQADGDVEGILHFITEVRKSPQGARAWYQAYEEALARLAETAASLPLAPENEFVAYEIRHIVFKTRRGRTYRALFTIVDHEVRLLHVRGPGQDVLASEDFDPLTDD